MTTRAGLVFAAAAAAAVLAGCTGTPAPPASTPPASTTVPAPATQAPTARPGQSATDAATEPRLVRQLELELDTPWATVFLPDGTAVISERDSALLKSVKDGRASTIGEVPGVVPGGEGGLLGLAVSPGFATDRYLYAYFTAATDNRIARIPLTAAPDGRLTAGTPEVIFSGISKASTHNGGRIRFGPDGMLYVGTGDSQRRDQPQDPEALGGKILRLTPDGSPAPGNPFGNNPVYSLGHRNVQGLAWDREGRLWASEFGPTVDDELNLITPGGNYGWPDVTGAPGRSPFIDAKVVWPDTAESSPSGLEIVGTTAYLGALRGQRLWTVKLDGESAGQPVSYFTREHGRLRDVALAPTGELWVLSNGQNPDFALIVDPAG
ncbi:PQQ-dependent sugar dehydrogenase [Pseudarthrobacter sp. J64]|uniref:PQQ-dependent sugar dehydrogenase n=1 Tax=Pseudarthrobacter sp. J64 TaxID=3116485 RepID=UPI002E81F884|nr:PQQ-dependent sugar dehydrogenase [Pseudarthrobacter sp. J64]MEE2568451.1 PQQ-dependent sugar dehydrogenase [Pseudarthrobacter sp. J64]